MSQKDFSLIAGVIFLIVAVFHAVRLIMGWPARIAGWDVPMWISWPALIFRAERLAKSRNTLMCFSTAPRETGLRSKNNDFLRL